MTVNMVWQAGMTEGRLRLTMQLQLTVNKLVQLVIRFFWVPDSAALVWNDGR
jgi:hypothetical protein